MRTLASIVLLVVAAASLAGDTAKPQFPSEVSISMNGDSRVIRANGIPNHVTGQFPGAGNPNRISPQHYEYRIPANPVVADHTTVLRMQAFGVAVNGVVFDPFAAEWWNGDRNWQYEPLKMAPLYLGADASHGHVQPNGAYHYHGIPTALVYSLTGGKPMMVIVGWAADGFPIYNAVGHTNPKDGASPLKPVRSSYQIKKGQRDGGPGGSYDGLFVADYEYVAESGDLDECNGRFEITPEYPAGIYHYVLTEQFPFIPRFFRGTPDKSFARGGPGGGGGPGGPNGQGGPGRGYRILPRYVEPQLNLTDEQQKQINELDAETKAALSKILSPEQMKALMTARPPGMGPGGPDNGPPQPSRLRAVNRTQDN